MMDQMAGELLELVIGPDPKLRHKVTLRVRDIIAESFRYDRSRVTRSEITRRFRIIETLIREMRSGFGWAFERILDEAPVALRHKLDGTPWTPDLRRQSWIGSV